MGKRTNLVYRELFFARPYSQTIQILSPDSDNPVPSSYHHDSGKRIKTQAA